MYTPSQIHSFNVRLPVYNYYSYTIKVTVFEVYCNAMRNVHIIYLV